MRKEAAYRIFALAVGLIPIALLLVVLYKPAEGGAGWPELFDESLAWPSLRAPR
jgi:hypothetical protein